MVVLVKNPLEVDRPQGEIRMDPMTGMTTLTTASTAQTATSLKESLQGKVMILQQEERNPIRININPLRSEGSGRATNETRRFKEHDTAKVPKFPTLPNFFAWKLQVGKSLVAAGGRVDLRKIAWWAEASKDASNFDSLEGSGEDRFVSLDLKLSISLSVMLKEVNNEVTSSTAQREHAAAMQGRMLKGRQIAWLIFNYLKEPQNRSFLQCDGPCQA